jgi:nucleotide-binding universal stress UspA family protein
MSPLPVWITHPRPGVEIGCVLAATDFSETAERAASIALDVAAACSADLHLVHACDEPLAAHLWAAILRPT